MSVSIERPALYIVATPIGNLADISLRAIAVLRAVDEIFAEDTRVTKRLLAHHGIDTKLTAVHEHNERAVARKITARMCTQRLAAALVSDAGTPSISDPGMVLIKALRDNDIPIRIVPGPSAAIAALVVSGLPVDRFTFEGFLPPRAAAREKRLTELLDEPRTMVFFEAPHRLARTLASMTVAFGGGRAAFVGRELTKLYESGYSGTLDELCRIIADDPNATRGELVIVVGGNPGSDPDRRQAGRVLSILRRHLGVRDAVAVAAEITGRKRNFLYALAHETGGESATSGD
jgi:16S rRNA (cytidine1402-2'-O)-methyltransferase